MLKLEIMHCSANTRLIVAKADDLMRWHLTDMEDTPLKWERLGKSQAMASVKGEVQIFKKPNSMAVHFEQMAHNKAGLFLGTCYKDIKADSERVTFNMLEFEGLI